MLGVDPHGLAHRRLTFDDVVPPQVARFAHRHVLAGALEHDHVADARAAAGERLVGRRLEIDDLAAAPAAIGRDQQRRAGILDAVLERQRGETAEHDRVNRADARAGVHGDDRFGRHRHVDDDAVARLHAERRERIRESADVGVQLAVRHVAHVARLADEGDRGLVAALLEMNVEAVVGDVELAVGEPAIVRRLRFVERDRKRLVPAQFGLRMAGPESLVVARRLGAHPFDVGGLEPCLVGEFRGGSETPLFDENGLDVLAGHGREGYLGITGSCKPKGPLASLNEQPASKFRRTNVNQESGCCCSPWALHGVCLGQRLRVPRGSRRRRRCQGRREGRAARGRRRHEGGRPFQRRAHRGTRHAPAQANRNCSTPRRSACAAKAMS